MIWWLIRKAYRSAFIVLCWICLLVGGLIFDASLLKELSDDKLREDWHFITEDWK